MHSDVFNFRNMHVPWQNPALFTKSKNKLNDTLKDCTKVINKLHTINDKLIKKFQRLKLQHFRLAPSTNTKTKKKRTNFLIKTHHFEAYQGTTLA